VSFFEIIIANTVISSNSSDEFPAVLAATKDENQGYYEET
jgi:hypothetical protein